MHLIANLNAEPHKKRDEDYSFQKM